MCGKSVCSMHADGADGANAIPAISLSRGDAAC